MPDEIQIADAREISLQELCERASALVSGARSYIGQMSNYATVLTSFELGRYIVEEEQNGQDRAPQIVQSPNRQFEEAGSEIVQSAIAQFPSCHEGRHLQALRARQKAAPAKAYRVA